MSCLNGFYSARNTCLKRSEPISVVGVLENEAFIRAVLSKSTALRPRADELHRICMEFRSSKLSLKQDKTNAGALFYHIRRTKREPHKWAVIQKRCGEPDVEKLKAILDDVVGVPWVSAGSAAKALLVKEEDKSPDTAETQFAYRMSTETLPSTTGSATAGIAAPVESLEVEDIPDAGSAATENKGTQETSPNASTVATESISGTGDVRNAGIAASDAVVSLYDENLLEAFGTLASKRNGAKGPRRP